MDNKPELKKENPLMDLDNALAFLAKETYKYQAISLNKMLTKVKADLNLLDVLEYLKDEGFIIIGEDEDKQTTYKITHKGWIFYKISGYQKRDADERKEKSKIITTRFIAKVAVFVSVISAIIAGLNYLATEKKNDNTEKSQLATEALVRQQLKSVDSLVKFQRSIDVSIQEIAKKTDTVYLKK